MDNPRIPDWFLLFRCKEEKRSPLVQRYIDLFIHLCLFFPHLNSVCSLWLSSLSVRISPGCNILSFFLNSV